MFSRCGVEVEVEVEVEVSLAAATSTPESGLRFAYPVFLYQA